MARSSLEEVKEKYGDRDTLVMNPGIPFRWDERRRGAAQDFAIGKMSASAISRKYGCSHTLLRRWRSHPQFMAEVEKLRKEWQDEVREAYFGNPLGRVQSLYERLNEIEEIWRARGTQYTEDDGTGGTTGHIVKRYKSIGTGPMAEKATEYEADVALLREYRGIEQQIAQELGQWDSKASVSLSGADGAPLVQRIVVHAPPSREEYERRAGITKDRETEEEAPEKV